VTAIGDPIRLTALLACHDRRDVTVRCLESLFRTRLGGLELDAVVVDDGSGDGTGAAVMALGLPVRVVPGPGDWFWARSMAEAERVAEQADPDAVLWLNDDVDLSPSALFEIVHGLRRYPDTVLVGGLTARDRPKLTYSGFGWSDRACDEVHRIRPDGTYRLVDGFHGNVVVVPRSVRRLVGPIDGTWPHNFGDLDVARRLNTARVPIRLLPSIAGRCDGHVVDYLDPQRRPWSRLWAVLGRRGWPLRANWRYHHRHGLPLGGGHFTAPYRRAWRGRRPGGSPGQDGA
jgi:GT2 family glycosyltransferase